MRHPVSNRLTSVTLTIEAADFTVHCACGWEPSQTRVYVVRGERPPLHVADASDTYATVELIAGLLTDRYLVDPSSS